MSAPTPASGHWREHVEQWLADIPRRSSVLWRGVEAQYQIATMSLVDSADEQALLEEALEQFKPPLPEPAQSLHYLIGAPFRYASRWPSRFRTSDDPGIWYGAHKLNTACAEVAYWRWRFVQDSEAFGEEPVLTEHSFYTAKVQGRVIDLANAPWDAWRADWMHRDDYSTCQALARAAREAGVDWIQYRSARDPKHGLCGAVLSPWALTVGDLTNQLSWVSAVRGHRVTLTRKGLGSPYEALEFCFAPEPQT